MYGAFKSNSPDRSLRVMNNWKSQKTLSYSLSFSFYIDLNICLSTISTFPSLSIYLSMCLSTYLSIFFCLFLTLSLSIFVFISLSSNEKHSIFLSLFSKHDARFFCSQSYATTDQWCERWETLMKRFCLKEENWKLSSRNNFSLYFTFFDSWQLL